MEDAPVYKFISSMQICRSCTSTFWSKTKCQQDMFYIHYCFKSLSCILFSSCLFSLLTGEKSLLVLASIIF